MPNYLFPSPILTSGGSLLFRKYPHYLPTYIPTFLPNHPGNQQKRPERSILTVPQFHSLTQGSLLRSIELENGNNSLYSG